MAMIRIYETDDYITIAQKIFDYFEIGNSCTIRGTLIDNQSEEVVSKGEYTLKQLRHLDSIQNVYTTSDKRLRRRRKVLDNSIGGYVAQKIFKYKISESGLKVDIWRVQ